MWNEDIGHIAHRKYEQSYESSVFVWSTAENRGTVEIAAEIPERAGLRCEIRSAPKREDLEGKAWRRVEYGRFGLAPEDRSLQYRLVLTSANGDRYPVIDKITIKVID
jgi:hypothetical protein